MNLTRSAEALGCAPTSDLREGNSAGVLPGLQSLGSAASVADVADVAQDANRCSEGVNRHELGARRPDRKLADLGADVAARVAARFWSKVDRSGECWLWKGHVAGKGYGYFNVVRGIVARAHRLAYEIEHGAIGEGLVIDHLCRNRLCVNPAHLEAVTNRENVLRGSQDRMVAARTNTCMRGHSLLNARMTPKGRYCRECARLREAARRAARKAVSA